MKAYLSMFTLSCLLVVSSLVHAGNKISLKQKKLMNDESIKTSINEELAEIKKSCGCQPEVEMDWSTVENLDDALLSRKAASHVKYEMQSLCKQGLKKEACQIKKVKVKKGAANVESKATYSKGVLSMEAGGSSNWGMPGIDKLLEENL